MIEPKRLVTFDLTRLAAHLDTEGKHLKLRKMIGQLHATASAHKDLTDARDALLEMEQVIQGTVQGAIVTRKMGVVAGALFAHAIILYARATGTQSDERIGWFGSEKLSLRHRQWHQEVMQYRNEVVAHFGRGDDHVDGAAISDQLVLGFFDFEGQRASRIDYSDRRAHTRARLSAKLKSLINETIKLSREAFDKRSRPLVGEIDRVSREDRSLLAVLHAHRVEPDAFFGDREPAGDVDEDGGVTFARAVQVDFLEEEDTSDLDG